MADHRSGMLLIDGNGVFNKKGLENFTRTTKFNDRVVSYTIVAITGPQSSGKSTLLNHLLHTKFEEMDASKGRTQTTKGIWIADCNIGNHFTIAMDIEGTDSMERGEDDTKFEKQSTLFALAIADILLINIWCKDIGRENGANRPLLRTVFQSPLAVLERTLKKSIEKIWASVDKPDALKNSTLRDFFNVEFVALSNYEEKEDQFKEEVSQLRQRLFDSISSGLDGKRQGVQPASVFSTSSIHIWKTIELDKHLDLPAHKVMVATFLCAEIAKEKFESFTSDEDWLALAKEVKAGSVLGFGKNLSSILEKYLSQKESKCSTEVLSSVLVVFFTENFQNMINRYDKETEYLEESVRKAKRQELKSRALDVVYPSYASMLEHLSSKTLESFKINLGKALNKGEGFAASVRTYEQSGMLDFEKHCEDAPIRQANDWYTSEVRKNLHSDILTHVSDVRSSKLSEMTAKYEKQLSDRLSGDLRSIFKDDKRDDTWASVRDHLEDRIQVAESNFSTAVASFELDSSTIDTRVQNLRVHARNVVIRKSREESERILSRMKDRFSWVFNHDNCSNPRVWKSGDDIESIKKNAFLETLKILSTMAVVRLDNVQDNIENVLFTSLIDGSTPDALASKKWKMVSPETMLLSPVECQSVWQRFEQEIEYMVSQAKSAKKAHEDNIKAGRRINCIGGGLASAMGLATGVCLMAAGVDTTTASAIGQITLTAMTNVVDCIQKHVEER